jgi:hypothetical protein
VTTFVMGGFPQVRCGLVPDTYTSLNYPAGTLFPCGVLTTENGSREALGIT